MTLLADLLPGAAHLQNLHPLVVHYPLALLSAAAAIYFIAVLFGRPAWGWPALWMLVLGMLGAAVAVASGLYAQEGVMVAPSVRQHLLENHERLMLATLALSVLATGWALVARPLPVRGRMAFVLLLLAMMVVMVKGADYGGRLVYDYNAGGDACGQPINFTH